MLLLPVLKTSDFYLLVLYKQKKIFKTVSTDNQERKKNTLLIRFYDERGRCKWGRVHFSAEMKIFWGKKNKTIHFRIYHIQYVSI